MKETKLSWQQIHSAIDRLAARLLRKQIRKTRDRYREKFPSIGFEALIDKTTGALAGWVKFPWEQQVELDAEDIIRRFFQVIGEDANRSGLEETPARVVKSWKEIYGGYKEDPAKILEKDFSVDYDEMILSRGIEFFSTCEHHLLPFYGVAHVAYIPGEKTVGISKLSRLVDAYARRLQIQERMTAQIADAIVAHIKPRGVGVVIEAKHTCMVCRGVKKQNSDMVTSKLTGPFRDDPMTRAEFFQLINRSK